MATTNCCRPCPSAQDSVDNARHSAGEWPLSSILPNTGQAASPASSSPPGVFVRDRRSHDQRAGCVVAEEQPLAQGESGPEPVLASVPRRAALYLVQAGRVFPGENRIIAASRALGFFFTCATRTFRRRVSKCRARASSCAQAGNPPQDETCLALMCRRIKLYLQDAWT